MTDLAAHPEHVIRCPWCQAPARSRCTTRRGRPLGIPSHQARKDAWTRTATWARATAVCPVCQVAPGTDCHTGGRPLHAAAVHPERITEGTAA